MSSTPSPPPAVPGDAPLLRELGRGRLGMERVGSGATLVLVLVLGFLLCTAALLAHVVAPSQMPRVPQGTTLAVEGAAEVDVTVPAGWRLDEGATDSSHLVLVRSGLRVSVIPATAGVRDPDVYFSRTVRLVAIGGITGRTEGVRSATGNGITAITGTVDGPSEDVYVAVAVAEGGAGTAVVGVVPGSGDDTASQRQFAALLEGVVLR